VLLVKANKLERKYFQPWHAEREREREREKEKEKEIGMRRVNERCD
jgi:hypothetical protein